MSNRSGRIGKQSYSQRENKVSSVRTEKPVLEMSLRYEPIIYEGYVNCEISASAVGRSVAHEKYIAAFNSGNKFDLNDKFDQVFKLLLSEKYGLSNVIKRENAPPYKLNDLQVINFSEYFIIQKKIYPVVILISKNVFKKKEGYTVVIQDVKPDRDPKEYNLLDIQLNHIKYPPKELFETYSRTTIFGADASSRFSDRLKLLTRLHDSLKKYNNHIAFRDIDRWLTNCLGASLNTNMIFLLDSLFNNTNIIISDSSTEIFNEIVEEFSKEYVIQNETMMEEYKYHRQLSAVYNTHLTSIVSLFLQIHSIWQSEFSSCLEKYNRDEEIPSILIKDRWTSFNKFMEQWFINYKSDTSSRKKELLDSHVKLVLKDLKRYCHDAKFSDQVKQEIKLLTDILAEKLDELSKEIQPKDFYFPRYMWNTLNCKV